MQSFIFDDAIRFRLATQQEDNGAKIQVFFGVFLGGGVHHHFNTQGQGDTTVKPELSVGIQLL